MQRDLGTFDSPFATAFQQFRCEGAIRPVGAATDPGVCANVV